jgi:hypothetical protein
MTENPVGKGYSLDRSDKVIMVEAIVKAQNRSQFMFSTVWSSNSF